MPGIELSQVSKRFGESTALHGVSLEVSPGEVLVLLGHNGAGKTVTVRLLSTMSWPTSGTVAAVDTPDGLRSHRRHDVSLEDAFLGLVSQDESPAGSGR